ncbi:hypothetical protein, partial [Schleiferia thermophila]
NPSLSAKKPANNFGWLFVFYILSNFVMKNNLLKFFLIKILLLWSCSVKKGAEVKTINKLPTLEFYDDVIIISDQSLLPDNRRDVGTIQVTHSDYHDVPCGWIERLTAAQLEARKYGGNLILLDKITGHVNLATNSCGVISGYVYNVDESTLYRLKNQRINGGLRNKYDFARVVFIKPTFATNYSIYVNKENLGLIKGGEIVEYKTKNKELLVIWAKTDRKSKLVMNVEPGYDYFVLCNELPMGLLLPTVQFVTLQPEVAIDLINRMKR